MEVGLFWAEKGMLVLGALFVLTSMMQYGRLSTTVLPLVLQLQSSTTYMYSVNRNN